MALLLISFIAGLLTVLAPCTLPLLPVIIGESVSGKPSIKRAAVTILSLGASLFLFTFLLKVSTAFISVPQQVWAYISGGLLIVFGLVTLFPDLWDRLPFVQAMNRSGNRALGKGYLKHTFWGDMVVGAALGPVFSSCSPTYFLILATVLPVSLTKGVLYLCVYIIGLCIALLLIAMLGQRLVGALGIASDPRGWFKKTIGVLFVVIGLLIVTGYSTTLEAALVAHSGNFDVTQVEQRLLAAQTTNTHPAAESDAIPAGTLTLAEKALRYEKAPELVHPDAYLNTNGQPITIGQFKGKDVVLVDFWTYSCINCLRTLPYITAWYSKYKDDGLVVIGVHTPEFAFEHVEANVAQALKRYGVTYPVVLDNEYATWNAFGNEVWPREYLIDIDGYIVHDHSGEGDYDVTERAIQAALRERAARLGLSTTTIPTSLVSVNEQQPDNVQSPETYFGGDRNEYLGNGTQGQLGPQTLSFPSDIQLNTLYLSGTWNFEHQYATASSTKTEIRYEYDSDDVYFVASAPTATTITVLRDGKPLGTFAGSDVDSKTSTATIQADRLYKLIQDPTPGVHTLDIIITTPGLEAYTFTFG